MRRALPCLLVVLALAACSAPRQPPVPRDVALRDDRELELTVIKPWDALRLKGPSESSHVVEVEVLDGPAELVGKRLTLPYDEWMVGAPPPKAGTVLRTSARAWVARDRGSRGKPFSGWDDERPLERK